MFRLWWEEAVFFSFALFADLWNPSWVFFFFIIFIIVVVFFIIQKVISLLFAPSYFTVILTFLFLDSCSNGSNTTRVHKMF